uniref:Uncharacterized protein n=1 Tax=Acrobeloides nanus TaxID=290746 RepID=A0A914CW54_9BILA
MQILKDQKFFDCYPVIQQAADRIEADIREYLGGFRETIETAARYYFFDLKKDRPASSTFKICFQDKPTGVHSGRLCTVIDHDGESNFYIKTNYGGPTKSNSKSRMAPNLREVFGYSLLQLIGIGPESHFICPPPGTATRTIFIATKAIPDFDRNRMDKLTSKTENIKTILLEIHILCSILCITDVHQDNCGQFNMKPMIIDFAIPWRDDYRVNVRQIICEKTPPPADILVNGVENKDLKKVADECSSEERINIAKTALKKWNLMEAIEKAKTRTNEVKEHMRLQGIEIQRTDDFAKYIEEVKYNCSFL